MKCHRYLLTKQEKISESLGFTEIKEERLVWMPQDPEEFNKKLELFKKDLKTGQCYTFRKVSVGKRYYQVEAAE